MPIVLNGSTGITTPTYNGTNTAEYVVPVTSFKNRIINGSMVIDQRNAGAAITSSGFVVDRFNGSRASATVSYQQSSIVPTAGFSRSLSLTVTTGALTAAGDTSSIQQGIEGFNTADFMWGTANARTVTLSFWVRSSVTGSYGASFRNGSGNRSYVASYTVNAANTWEYKTITIAGDTSGTWATDNSAGIYLNFDMGVGSTFSTTAGTWRAGNFFGLTGGTKIQSTTGATFYITGVQLEVGSTATSFDYRPYSAELAMCQRYYYKVFPAATGIMLSTGWGASTTTNLKAAGAFPVTIRTRPSALEQNGTANNYQVVVAGTGTTCSAVPTYDGATGADYWIVNGIVSSGLTAGQAGYLRTDSTNGATAYLAWSAEL